MNENDSYERPVAYDAEGRPLYAHPPAAAQTQSEPQPTVPKKQIVDDATAIKHLKSVKLFPNINITESEFIISAFSRHPIGLITPLVVGILLISMSMSVLFNYDAISQKLNFTGYTADVGNLIFPTFLFIALICIGMYVAYYVYTNNRFYLTNESVIQEIQTSLMSKREQTVSLGNIEDASFSQRGLLQQFFNYGSIRLSTEVDATTYVLSYVSNPKRQIAMLNNAIEDYKNGRVVDGD